MPGPPLDQTVSLTGADQVKSQLKDLGASGSASLKQLADGADAANKGFGVTGASINQLVGLLTNARGEIGDVKETFAGLSEVLQAAAPALTALLGAASLGGLYELAASATEAAREVQNMATAFGSTTEQFEGFQFALASVGVNTETANNALAKMTAFLGQTDEALRKAADSSHALAEAQQVTAERADLSAKVAHDAAANAFTSYTNAANGIAKAQVAADKAALSYDNLRTKIRDSGATGEQARQNTIRLADAQSQLQSATEGITAAQQRSSQAATAASNAQRQASIADDERRAQLDKLAEEQNKGLNATQKWLEQIGVASAALTEAGTNGTEAFYKIIQGLSGVSDAAQRAEYARAIFGRGWVALVPAIAAGGEKLAAFAKEFEETGLGLEKDGFAAASAFQKATAQLSFFVEAVKNYLGTKIAGIFAPLIQATADWIAKNSKQIKEWADGLAHAIQIVINGFRILVPIITTLIVPAFQVLMSAANALASLLNHVFGTELTGSTLIFLGILKVMGAGLLPIVLGIGRFVLGISGLSSALRAGYLALALFAGAGGLGGLVEGLALVLGKGNLVIALILLLINLFSNWDTIQKGNEDAVNGFWQLLVSIWGWFRDTWVAVFDTLLEKFTSWIAGLQTNFQSWADWINGQIQAVADFFSNAWNSAISFVEGLWNGFVDWVSGVATKIISAFQPVLEFFRNLWSVIQAVTGAGASEGAPSATGGHGGEVHAAGGGRISGPGTGTSDSVPAMLSNGEFVINTRAAQNVGYGFLHAINSGAMAMRAMGGMVRMAMGGMVGAPIRMAGGGIVAAGAGNPGGMAAVHLHLGGSTYSLIGERGVVQALTGAARKAAMTATGKAPGWKR